MIPAQMVLGFTSTPSTRLFWWDHREELRDRPDYTEDFHRGVEVVFYTLPGVPRRTVGEFYTQGRRWLHVATGKDTTRQIVFEHINQMDEVHYEMLPPPSPPRYTFHYLTTQHYTIVGEGETFSSVFEGAITITEHRYIEHAYKPSPRGRLTFKDAGLYYHVMGKLRQIAYVGSSMRDNVGWFRVSLVSLRRAYPIDLDPYLNPV